MSEQEFPQGWDNERVTALLARYAAMSEDEQVVEDEEAAQDRPGQATITVPEELLPEIRLLLARVRSA